MSTRLGGRALLVIVLLFVALLSLGSLALVPASASPQLVDQRVQDRVQKEGRARVIVELHTLGQYVPEGAASDEEVAAQRLDISAGQSEVAYRLRSHWHRIVHRYASAPLLALEVGPDALRELEAAGFAVKRVIEDALVRPALAQSVPLIQASQAWAQGLDGTGWTVAILDTGVDSAHPFLRQYPAATSKVIEEACYSSTVPGSSLTFCPNGQDTQTGAGAGINCPDLDIGCWHGTHVAGIAAGHGGGAGQSFSGVARGATLMAIQVFSKFTRSSDCSPSVSPCIMAYTSDIIAGLERVYQLRGSHNFASVNLSLGGALSDSPCDADPTKPLIDNLRSVGIATVVASGNDGSTDSISSPACISTSVSVASTTDTSDAVSSFSNVASFVSLFAPGEVVTSSYPGGLFANAYGTSMAAPHVAGSWAVFKQAVPDATVADILTALQQTGLPRADTRPGGTVTKPRIRVLAALSFSGVAPDLVVTSITNPPATASIGTSFTVTDTALNQGNATAGSSTTRYYLSSDGVTLTKLLTGARTVPVLAANVSSTGTLNVTIPTSTVLGTYFLLACPDDTRVVTERNETNNCRASATTVQVGISDLVASAVSNPPGAASVGGSFAVTDTVLNQGSGPSTASTTRYYLSGDGVALTKLLTGARSVPVLAANMSSTGTLNVTIPTSTVLGAYFLLACPDDTRVVTESNETNNCRASATAVQVGISDLVASAVSNPPGMVSAGGSFAVTDTVLNQGSGPSTASTTRYYLSSDGVALTKLLTGARAVPVLAVNATSTGTVTVTVPASTVLGTYVLLACADDTRVVTESSETNNCRASAGTVQVGISDLVASAVSNPPGTASAGGSFAVTDTVLNQGSGPSTASTTRYYLSSDGVAATKLLTGTRAVPVLAVNATSTGTVTVTVPTDTVLGAYFLLACADDGHVAAESSETNNCRASAGTVQVGAPMSVSGTVYADEGITRTSASLRLVVGGSTAFTTSAGLDGRFTFAGIPVLTAGTVLTLYVDNTPGKTGAVVTRAGGSGDVTGLDVYLNRLIVRHGDPGPLTNVDLRVCNKTAGTACSDSDLHFSVTATTLALTVDPDWMLYIWPATTFRPGGTVTLAAGSAAAEPGGDLKFGASTSVLDADTRAITVGGDWINTAGGAFLTADNQLVTFTAAGSGFGLSGLLTAASAFQKVLFESTTGAWTIRDPIRIVSTASDAFTVANGSVTLGDGAGDDLEIWGGLKIATASGQNGTLQVALLPPGERITIHVNAPSTPTCSTCTVVVGAAGASGRGVLRLNRSAVLRLNARSVSPASDVGLEVQATGYLEIVGSVDETGQAAASTDATTLSDPTKLWTPGQHDGKVLRISSADSLAFGRVYRITGTSPTAVVRSDTSSSVATVSTVTAAAASRTVCFDHAGVISRDREGVGRYLEVRSPGSGYLKVVHSVNDDPACPVGADSVVVIGEPDPLSLVLPAASVAIVDGVRPGDAYQIISPAEVGADAGPACTAMRGGLGAAYLWAKAGSETVIQWAHLCNLGRNAQGKKGLTFSGVNGANGDEGVTLAETWIELMGHRAVVLDGARNNAGTKGIRDTYIATTESYGIAVEGSSANNAIVRNRILDTTNAISIEPGASNNVVAFNHLSASRGFVGNGVHGRGSNNTVAYNQLCGNQASGLRLTKTDRQSWVYGNDMFGNGDGGISIESSVDTTLFANRVHANGVGIAASVADPNAAAVAGLRSIRDMFGRPVDNRSGDVAYAAGGGHTAVLYRTELASRTVPDRVARSGNVANNQSTSMSRVVTGPGTLTFDWATSSEAGFDILSFAIDGVTQASISGNQPWATPSFPLPSGGVTIGFTYTKDGSDAHGLDAGMVDNVRIDGVPLDDFEGGTLAGWTVAGSAPWRNTARVESVSGVTATGASLLARRHGDVAGLTWLIGQYRVPSEVAETPQAESIERFNFADPLWAASATPHAYRGTGTDDASLDYDLTSANLSGGPYHYRAVATSGGPCASALFAVTRNGGDVGMVRCGETFTDVVDGVGVRFRIDGGAPAAYVPGDAYAFVVWDASGDGGVAKRLVVQQDGDRLSVPVGTGLELKGEGPGVNATEVTRGGTGGYQVVVDGTIVANAYVFEYLGGTGQSAGLVLNASATIVSLDNGAFDRFAVPGTGVSAFVRVDGTLIGDGTPARQLSGMRFDNATGFATCSLDAVGSATGFWQIGATGGLAGEDHDCAAGAADDTPGRFRW